MHRVRARVSAAIVGGFFLIGTRKAVQGYNCSRIELKRYSVITITKKLQKYSIKG
jgi:hypothetical protein